jgi:hypothetical protein
MASKIIPCIAAAVIAAAGSHAALAQYQPIPFHPAPTYPVPSVPYTPPLQYQAPQQPYYAQPIQPPPPPMVVVPFNAFGSTIR